MGHLQSGVPWDTLAIDYLGPLPLTENGNKYIMVLTDYFTKYVEVLSVPNQLAEDCALRIPNEFVSRLGTPLKINTDQGPTFESNVFKELCSLFQVKKSRTSPRNPKCNGQIERYNKTLLKIIKAYLIDQTEWDLFLGCIVGAYRPNETTKLTPNMMCNGREVRLPGDLVYKTKEDDSVPLYRSFMEAIQERMLRAHEVARKHLKASAKRSKDLYDTKMLFVNYKDGDIVWLLHESRTVGISPKLEKRYDGPYIIVKKMSPITFVVQMNPEGHSVLIHNDKLKMWARKIAKRITQ
jgi:hypothetical protein